MAVPPHHACSTTASVAHHAAPSAPPRLVPAAHLPLIVTAPKVMATKAVPRMLMPLRVLLLRQLQPTAHPTQSRTQRGMLLLSAPMTLLTVAPMMLVQMASLTPVQMA